MERSYILFLLVVQLVGSLNGQLSGGVLDDVHTYKNELSELNLYGNGYNSTHMDNQKPPGFDYLLLLYLTVAIVAGNLLLVIIVAVARYLANGRYQATRTGTLVCSITRTAVLAPRTLSNQNQSTDQSADLPPSYNDAVIDVPQTTNLVEK